MSPVCGIFNKVLGKMDIKDAQEIRIIILFQRIMLLRFYFIIFIKIFILGLWQLTFCDIILSFYIVGSMDVPWRFHDMKLIGTSNINQS